MPGANYMGGKRNVMKARAKDTIGRQQKGFFGRKRLDMLAQGLSASKPSGKPRSPPSFPVLKQKGPRDITLAHARYVEEDHEQSTLSYVPSPIHISNSFPRSKKRLRTAGVHTSSSEVGRSAVLDTLDTSEPIFLRAVMDRILAMPDLASLNGIPEKQSSPVLPRKRKRASSEMEDIEEATSISSDSRVQTPEPSSSRRLHVTTPARTTSLVLDADDSSDIYVENDAKGIDLMDEDFRDSGYAESFEGLIDMDSDPWSIQQHWSSSGLGAEQQEEDLSSDSLNSFRKNPSSNLDEVFEEPDMCATSDGYGERQNKLPSVITFGKRRRSEAQHPETIYGTLFEQQDPWRAIGTILGIDSDGVGADKDPESRARSGSDETQDQLVEEVHMDEIEHPGGFKSINHYTVAARSESVSVTKRGSRCVSDEARTRRIWESSPSSSLSKRPESVPADDQQVLMPSEEAAYEVDESRYTKPEFLEDHTNMTEVRGPEQVATKASNSPAAAVENIFGVPDLQEVDGLYLGPSLFGMLDMEDSDDGLDDGD